MAGAGFAPVPIPATPRVKLGVLKGPMALHFNPAPGKAGNARGLWWIIYGAYLRMMVSVRTRRVEIARVTVEIGTPKTEVTESLI